LSLPLLPNPLGDFYPIFSFCLAIAHGYFTSMTAWTKVKLNHFMLPPSIPSLLSVHRLLGSKLVLLSLFSATSLSFS
jgi:hypothetical protein